MKSPVSGSVARRSTTAEVSISGNEIYSLPTGCGECYSCNCDVQCLSTYSWFSAFHSEMFFILNWRTGEMALERHSRGAPWSGVGSCTSGSAFDLEVGRPGFDAWWYHDDILDSPLLFFDFGFYIEIDFLRGMVEWEGWDAGSEILSRGTVHTCLRLVLSPYVELEVPWLS